MGSLGSKRQPNVARRKALSAILNVTGDRVGALRNKLVGARGKYFATEIRPWLFGRVLVAFWRLVGIQIFLRGHSFWHACEIRKTRIAHVDFRTGVKDCLAGGSRAMFSAPRPTSIAKVFMGNGRLHPASRRGAEGLTAGFRAWGAIALPANHAQRLRAWGPAFACAGPPMYLLAVAQWSGAIYPTSERYEQAPLYPWGVAPLWRLADANRARSIRDSACRSQFLSHGKTHIAESR